MENELLVLKENIAELTFNYKRQAPWGVGLGEIRKAAKQEGRGSLVLLY